MSSKSTTSIPKSQWHKWLSQPGNIRVVSVEATQLMHELCHQHTLAGLAQFGFAEAVVGSLLIASAHKSNESINMNAQGSGIFRQAIVDASPEGRVRGFLIEEKDKSMHTYGVDGMAGPWGTGILSILYTKNFEGKAPYTGMVPISNGYLDMAINEYYKDSEQLKSKVGLYVDFDGQHLRSVRGALVQTLGGADEDEQEWIDAITLMQMRELAREAEDTAFLDKVSRLLGNRHFQLVESSPLVAFCHCSQDRIERALLLTGEKDVMEALGSDPMMNISCDFCRKQYKVSAERLKALFKRDSSRLQ